MIIYFTWVTVSYVAFTYINLIFILQVHNKNYSCITYWWEVHLFFLYVHGGFCIPLWILNGPWLELAPFVRNDSRHNPITIVVVSGGPFLNTIQKILSSIKNLFKSWHEKKTNQRESQKGLVHLPLCATTRKFPLASRFHHSTELAAPRYFYRSSFRSDLNRALWAPKKIHGSDVFMCPLK